MPRPHYPPSTTGLPRVSKSSMESFLKCEIRWHLDQEQHVRGHHFATVAQVIGTAVAAGAAADNRQKLMGGVGLRLGEIVEKSVATYETEISESEIPEPKIEIERGKDSAADASRVYAVEVSPATGAMPGDRVALVEEPILATWGEVELVGTPDLFTEKSVMDLKTGQPWGQQRVDESRELTLYAMLYQARFGRIPERVSIESLYVRGGIWRASRYSSTRRMDEFLALYELVKRTARAMAASTLETARAAPEGAWWCSARWCPHWGVDCPVVAGRR